MQPEDQLVKPIRNLTVEGHTQIAMNASRVIS